MSQAQVLERLYYVPETTIAELSVMLNLSTSSVESNIRRLKKVRYVQKSSIRGYELTTRGKAFAERYYL